MTPQAGKLLIGLFLLTAACSSAEAPFSIANCQPADGNSLEGDLLGEAWQISTEAQPGVTMLAVAIDRQDMGAVEPSANNWYYAASDSIAVLVGGLPSRTTQAFGVLQDGSEVVFCPFGADDLIAAGGSIPLTSELVDLELRRGGSVVAAGHVSDAHSLSAARAFGFGVTPPGGIAIMEGAVRGPGAELRFGDPPGTTAP